MLLKERDYFNAKQILLNAVISKDIESMYLLAKMLYNGLGLGINKEVAILYFKKAIDNGYVSIWIQIISC